MNIDYTKEDDILIQSYFTIAFLLELKNNKFLESDCYKKMQFQDNFIKENLPSIGIDNRGFLIIALYTMLIIPKEFLFDKYPTEVEKLNDTIENIKSEANSSYQYDQEKINYIKHIRNAIAHLRVEFVDKAIKFTDENKKWYSFNWEDIPENDNSRLIEFLNQNFGIDWVKTAKIEKIENCRTIKVSTEKNYLSLKLNNEQTEVNLKIDDGRTDKFVVKVKKSKLNINKKRIEKCTITIPLMNVGTFLTELQKIFMKHIETLKVIQK